MTTNVHRQTVLVTGGRAPAALELARLLGRAGHRVLAAECVDVHLCARSRSVERSFVVPAPAGDEQGYVDGLCRIIREQQVDWLVPVCEEVFYIAKFRDRLAGLCNVAVGPIDTLAVLHSKWEFVRLLRTHGFDAPETRLVRSPEELALALREVDPEARHKWVLKPEFSRFASRVHIFTGRPAAPPTMRAGEAWVLQRFVSGRAVSTCAYVDGGRLLVYAAYAAEFTAGQGACITFEYEPSPQLMAWKAAIASKLDVTGWIAMDVIVAEDGALYPIECNPRLTSGIHLFGVGDRVDKAMFRAQAQPQPQPDNPVGAACAAHELPDARTNGVVTPRHGRSSMIAAAMLLYGLRQALSSPRRLVRWLRHIALSRDVLLRLDDMLPVVDQFRLYMKLWRTSQLRRVSLLESSTIDIEWNGER